jgi:hypothetical protein
MLYRTMFLPPPKSKDLAAPETPRKPIAILADPHFLVRFGGVASTCHGLKPPIKARLYMFSGREMCPMTAAARSF